MKFFKRALSVMLAVAMCIPTSLPSIAMAAETDSSDSSYTVTLDSPKNGELAFADSVEDSISVPAGEQVEMMLLPDDGFEVDKFMLKNPDTGKTIASKQTTDNIFSFTMPSMDVEASAKFMPLEDISVKEDIVDDLEDITPADKDETEDITSYEVVDGKSKDIPNVDSEIDKALDEMNDNGDQESDADESTRTTAYISNNLDDTSVNEAENITKEEIADDAKPVSVQADADKAGLAPTCHNINVNYNLVDVSSANLASSGFDVSQLISSVSQMQQIYAIDGNEDCFVAFIDFGKLNGVSDGTVATFSNSDKENPVIYTDDITYDANSGIAYIPKSLFYNDEGEEIVLDLQAQVFAPYTLDGEDKSLINVTVENNNGDVKEVAQTNKIAVSSFDVTLTFPLVTPETAKNLDINKLNLYINDSLQPAVFAENEYFFNKETGEMTIAALPVTVYSIKAVINGDTVAEKMVKSVSSEAKADIARQVKYESDIKMIPDVYLDQDFNTLQVNHSEIINTPVTYNTNESISAGDRAVVEKYFEYLCYAGQNYSNSLAAANAIANGSAALGDFVGNGVRTDFGDATGTTISSDMMELYNYLFTLPNLTNASLTSGGVKVNNQKLPLHSVMLFQGQNAEGNNASTVAADLAARPLRQSVVARCLYKNTKYGTKYGVFGFSVYNTDGTVAAYGIYKIPVNTPIGYIQIQKESANTGVTDGNEAYTFDGAQFQIYKGDELIRDEETGKDVFTLDASGKSDTIAVPVLSPTSGDTYIVKEVTAPSGYKINTTDQTIKVTTSHTTSNPCVAKFVETPYTYDADIKIDKWDKYSTHSEGDASLAGIKFEVLYYAGYGKDDFASLSGEPTRKWTISTKVIDTVDSVRDNGVVREYPRTYGHAELQEEYLVKGESDPLYKLGDGTVVMPIGTYIVRESDAGDGYKISGSMYVMQDNIKEPNYSAGRQGTDDPAKGLIFMVKANVPETSDYRSEIDASGHRLEQYETYKTTGYIGTTPSGVRNTNIIRKESVITATDTVKYGGFSIQKLDLNDRTKNPQGNAEDMSGLYGVKNLSKHAVTIKSENGIQINTGYASKQTIIDGIRYYTFEPVADNNMTNYMFTFKTDYWGKFTSSNSLLPYGTYEIDELTAPVGYQKNGIVTSKFSVRENGEVIVAPEIQNMIKRGSLFLVKFDAEDQTSTDQASGTLQGTYTVKNKSSHYVWILDNGTNEIQILRENRVKDDGERMVTGEGTWYKFEPEADMFTFTTKHTKDYAAVFQSSPYLLPYGTYEIRETGTHESYIISELRQGNNKATFTVSEQGQVIEFGTKAGVITNAEEIMSNPAARGGFTIQKNDADRKEFKDGENATSRKAQGDATFEAATYKVTTDNANYVWVKETPDITIYKENASANKEIDGEQWYKFTHGKDMFTFRVDANGDYSSPVDMLPYGTYTITEVSASEGYLATDERDSIISQQITITSEGQVIDLTYAKDAEDESYEDSFYEAVIRGGVKIQKNDADVYDYMSTTAQGDATFEGAVYDIYNISDSYVWVDTNNDGTYSDEEYYKPLDIDTSNEISLSYDDVKDAKALYTIATDKNGFAQTGNKVLPYGSYLIVERKPSEGYLAGTMRYGIVAHTFEVREEGVIVEDLTYASAEEDKNLENTFYEPVIRGGFDFQKNDDESGKNVPLGGANLNATYAVTNISNSYVWLKDEDGITLKTDGEDYYYDEATGYHFYGKNEVMFTFETDAHDGTFSSSNVLLPYGTYKITEIVPPNGYLLESNKNPSMETVFEVRNEGEMVDVRDDIYNLVMRGDFNFEKKDAETGTMMQYIPFLITSLDQDGQPVESHVVYTGTNGNYSTEADYTLHTYKTNKMDETIDDIDHVLDLLLAHDEEGVLEYMKKGDYYSKKSLKNYFEKENYGMALGVWFGLDTEPLDYDRTPNLPNVGALPFGRYRIDELPCEANDGKALVHNSFTILTEANRTTKANNPLRWQLGYKSAGIISYGTIYNWKKPLAPQMTTKAVVRASDTQFSDTDSTMVISDTVHYQGVIEDKDYTLVARVVDAVTGEYLRDVTGDIAMTSEYFTPNTSDGYIKMEISVDTKGYEGKTVVVYETLYDEHGDVFIDHSDPEDENQQIHFPNVGTKVIVEDTKEQVANADSSVTVIDTVSYNNLSAGTAYSVKSYLIDSETGAVITDAAGNRIESTQPFKPATANGTFDVTFTFDASKMAGKKLIVCEEIVENGYVISAHKDPKNDSQAVWIPALDTKISDKQTRLQMSLAENKAVVTDKISYTMVKPGLTYSINGTLLDAETGDEIATSTASFTPAGENGSENITFTFDASTLAGKTVVAVTDASYNSVMVASHNDVEDEDEMIHVPDIDTNAADDENKFKLSKADDEVTVVDTVSYRNLIPGYEYILSGYLADAETGMLIEDADGEPVVASDAFTAENADGEVKATFKFNGSKLAGKTAVVFESINVDTGDEAPLVAIHEDISDEDQTIHFPKLTADSVDKSNQNHITKAGKSVLTDTVKYENVIPGVEYVLSSKLVVKETREVLDTQEIAFTAEDTTGTVNVEYTVETGKLAGKTLVFIEDLQYKGYSVAEINDLNNKTETVYVPSLKTSAIDGENGTHVSNADHSVTITDTVTYTNLIPGKQYVMFGKIVDQETGEVLSSYNIDEPAYTERGDMHEKWTCQECGVEFSSRDEVLKHIDESDTCENYLYELYYDKIEHEEVGHFGEIAAVKPFIATSANGTVVMEFNFDGTGLEDKIVAVYEELYMENEEGIVLTEHYDCTNCDAKFGTKDAVEEHFRVSETGCNTYSFYYTTDMFSVAEHKDRYDDEQVIYIPKLTNKDYSEQVLTEEEAVASLASNVSGAGILNVANAETMASIPLGNHYIEAGKGSVVVDTVTYETFKPGESYTIIGTLIDKETGVSTGITSSYTFVPTQPHNDIELTFEFDSDEYAGRLLVATEVAYINSETHEVARYYDLNDTSKTIYIVKVDTQITDDGTKDNTASYGTTTITDTVTVEGLKPGTEYVGTGKLVNPETGEEYKNITVTIKPVKDDKDIITGNTESNPSDDADKNDSIKEEPSETNKPDGSSADISVEPPKPEENEEDKSIFDWIADKVVDFFKPVTSNETEFVAEGTTAKFEIKYEIDTSTMAGDSVVSFVDVKEKETNSVVGSHKDPADENQTIHVPELSSSKIIDAYTNNKQVMLGKTAVADEISYKNLVAGKTYMAKVVLKDAATGDILATAEENFVAEKADDKYQMTLYIDSSKAVGKQLSVTEEIYMNGAKVAMHNSNADVDLLQVAEIVTNAVSEKSSSQSAPVAGRTTIIDAVTYKNLIPGETYVVTGCLVDKDENEVVKVYNVTKEGEKEDTETKKEISVTFVPEKASGVVNVPFSVNTSDMSGKTFVGYETITFNGLPIAEHKNPDDNAQTIYVPTITSSAYDRDTKTNLISERNDAVVNDIVKAGNLVKGIEYTASAKLVEKETGKTVAEASKKFVAETTETDIELPLTFNALEYAGKTLICSDALSVNGVEIIPNKNTHDFHVGAVTTSVRDRATNIPMAEFDIDTKTIDTVTYNNLVPGLEYTFHGKLLSKKTGKILDTQDVVKTIDKHNGSVEVEFEFDTTTFDGRQFVAVETVSYNGVQVASHNDMEDDKQTMNVAEIGSEAFINGSKEVSPAASTLLVDTVNYDNLKTGYEYDMIGTVIDAKTGKEVICNGIPVTATVSFTPVSSKGVVDVPFTFDTTPLKGRTIVVYEELRYNNTLIASHKDINDAKQTVTILGNAQGSSLTIKYVDTTGKEIAPSETIFGKAGDSYKTEAKDIAGYKLTATPDNMSGTIHDGGSTVTFIYDRTDETAVVVRYVDEDGKVIADSTVVLGKDGDAYEVSAIEIPGYELKETPANAKGIIAKDITVTFVYKASGDTNGNVIVRYTENIDGKSIASSFIITGIVGETYSTSAKDIDGYTVSTVPSNANGIITKEDTIVTYIYTKDNISTGDNKTDNNNTGNDKEDTDDFNVNTGNKNQNSSSNNNNPGNSSSGSNKVYSSNNQSGTNNGNSITGNQSSKFTSNNGTALNSDTVLDGVKTGDYYAKIIVIIVLALVMAAAGIIILKKKRK